jgi:hypothetical protein
MFLLIVAFLASMQEVIYSLYFPVLKIEGTIEIYLCFSVHLVHVRKELDGLLQNKFEKFKPQRTQWLARRYPEIIHHRRP